jgi:hypothetical protein
MRRGNVLIDLRCRLRAAVAVAATEIESAHPVIAEGAFERSVGLFPKISYSRPVDNFS